MSSWAALLGLQKALDIPKALHSAANKLVLQAAAPEHLELVGRNRTVEESWVNLTHPLDRELKLWLLISPLSQSSLCSLGTSGSWSPAAQASREGWWFGNLIRIFLCQTPGVSCELLPQLRVPRLEMERKVKLQQTEMEAFLPSSTELQLFSLKS